MPNHFRGKNTPKAGGEDAYRYSPLASLSTAFPRFRKPAKSGKKVLQTIPGTRKHAEPGARIRDVLLVSERTPSSDITENMCPKQKLLKKKEEEKTEKKEVATPRFSSRDSPEGPDRKGPWPKPQGCSDPKKIVGGREEMPRVWCGVPRKSKKRRKKDARTCVWQKPALEMAFVALVSEQTQTASIWPRFAFGDSTDLGPHRLSSMRASACACLKQLGQDPGSTNNKHPKKDQHTICPSHFKSMSCNSQTEANSKVWSARGMP